MANLLIANRGSRPPDYFLIRYIRDRCIRDHISLAIQDLRDKSAKRAAIQKSKDSCSFVCSLNEVKILSQIRGGGCFDGLLEPRQIFHWIGHSTILGTFRLLTREEECYQ
jgi:hypothetical protein